MQIRKLKLLQIVEATCSEFVSEGLGICHIDSQDFKPLTGFTLGVMPGETFLAKVTRVKSNHFLAVVLPHPEIGKSGSDPLPDTWVGKKHEISDIKHSQWAIFNPSPNRIEPACSNFTFCGSCKMLHMKYSDTLDFKKKWLSTQLQRNHITFPDITVTGSPKEYHYRNHVQIHINKHKERGFYAPYSYTTKKFPAGGCLLFDQELVDRNFPEELELERCVRARIDYNENKAQIWSLYSKDEKHAKFTYNINFPPEHPTHISITNDTFFQTNTSIIPIWLKHIAEQIQEDNIQGTIRILELFSGFGFITSMLSMIMPIEALGMDILPPKSLADITIENSKFNSNLDSFKSRYIQHDINILDKLNPDNLKKILEFKADFILINPPRSGFVPAQINFLLEKILPDYQGSILYSSCNGATFARDAAVFQQYGCTIEKLNLLDFFPWTSHYEVLGKFKKLN